MYIAVSAAGVVDVGAVALQPGVGHGGRQQGRDQGAQSQVARHLDRQGLTGRGAYSKCLISIHTMQEHP